MTASLGERYRRLRDGAEAEFERNRRLHRGRIGCRKGCTECCFRLFSISEIEASEISRAVAALPPESAAALRRRAEQYVGERARILAAQGYVDARGNLPAPEARLACPALDEEGGCLIYESRPVSCRRYGAPMVHPGQPGRVFACELNFSPGESFEDSRLVPSQSEWAEDWEALQHAYDRAGGARVDEPLTLAHAVLDESLPDRAGS